MKHQPPSLGKKILHWVVNAEYVEEIDGDLEEMFYERLSYQPRWKVNLLYYLDVIRAIRPYQARHRSGWVGHEILNWIFLRLALRNLAKRRAYTAINVLGLSIGLATFLLIMEYVAFERSYDSFHQHADRIYRVAFDWGETDYTGENSSVYASSVPAMGPAVMREISGVENFTRFVPVLTVKSYCVLSFYESGKQKYIGNADHGFYADSSFLKIFSFPVITGGVNPLSQARSIVLTRSYAQTIFGDKPFDQIIGSSIEVDAQGKDAFIVTAILDDVPDNSHIQFDYLLSYSTIYSDRLEGNLGWSQFYTYIISNKELTNEAARPEFRSLIEKLYGKESHISIFLQPLKDIYLQSKLREEVGETGSRQQLIFLTIIAYVILFMAWINYINMFLARSLERINEIGVKKVLGSSRVHLVVQFFTESLVINVVSFMIAIGIFIMIQNPFESWVGKELSGVLEEQIPFTVILLCIVLMGTLITGLYPAFILSSHQPVQILGNKFQGSNQGMFFKQGLVYFQFIMSFVIVASTLIINRQIGFMKDADLGMKLNGRIALRSPGTVDSTYEHRLQLFKNRLRANTFIRDVTCSSAIPGKSINTSGGVQRVVGPDLEGNNVFYMQVDEEFLNTYDIRLIAGENFSNKPSASATVLINEAALQTLKFDSPEEALNHRIHWQRREFEVIGVFRNYNHLFLKESFEPIMLSFHPSANGFITLKVDDGKYEQALSAAKQEMKTLFPDTPFEYSFLESTYNRQYRSIQQFETMATFFAVLAIVIACLGLFCLSYYVIQRRVREVAVRKIFGAGLIDVLLLLSKKYVVIVLISCLLGTAITFYIMREWLQNFAFAIQLTPIDFLIPLLVILLLVIVTVFYNCLKTAIVNPSHSLRQN